MQVADTFLPIHPKLNVLLADDDEVDCLLFKEAIEELPVTITLTTVHDGEQLMDLLIQHVKGLPDVVFLDLNMPRKNGFAALGQIKRNPELQHLPVIIFSTASEEIKISQVYKDAAHYYIRKPAGFSELKDVLYKALALIAGGNALLPVKENFLLRGELKSNLNETESPAKNTTRKTN